MKQFYIKDLAKIINASTTSDLSPDSSFSSISTDSRATKKGDCFFAIKGPNFDGHDYLHQAFLNSASCAVVSKNVNTKKNPHSKRYTKSSRPSRRSLSKNSELQSHRHNRLRRKNHNKTYRPPCPEPKIQNRAVPQKLQQHHRPAAHTPKRRPTTPGHRR